MTTYRLDKGGAVISGVDESSPLRGEVEPGDRLLSINSRKPRDIIDLLWLQQEEALTIKVERRGGERVRLRLRKELGESLGLTFREPVFNGLRTCNNACSFCFVDQLPPGLRESLYVKDDDYRLSVLQGNFITLNDLRRRELNRILRLKLQPLYVSLHTTDARLRDRMMATRSSRKAFSRLRRIISGGMEVHLQVVLCPGFNDGYALEATLKECLLKYPARSLAVVPVNLLDGCGGDSGLRPLAPADAEEAIEIVEGLQRRALRILGRRFCYVSDEMFCMTGAPFPPAAYYEDWPQLENGVGMARKFIEEAREALKSGPALEGLEEVVVVTGRLGERVLMEALAGETGELPVRVLAVDNRVFGPRVTVSGLLGGQEIEEALRTVEGCRVALLPGSALCEDRFIDGLGAEDLARGGAVDIRVVEPEGRCLVEELRRLSSRRDS